MEEILRLLFQLQQVDSNLDEVEEQKGDLPSSVFALQEQYDVLTQAVKEKQASVTAANEARAKADHDIADFKEKLERYKTQQYQVRNNKEYDAITKEIDFANESIKSLEQQFSGFEMTMEIGKREMAEFQEKLDAVDAELKEKKAELAEISKETEDEELQYKHEREKIVVRLTTDILAKYERIRKNRGGRAISVIRKHSCSGCNNRIPPQHVLEIRKNTEIYTCQHCGRLIVSDELADATKKSQ